jgi:hypothetical protein
MSNYGQQHQDFRSPSEEIDQIAPGGESSNTINNNGASQGLAGDDNNFNLNEFQDAEIHARVQALQA